MNRYDTNIIGTCTGFFGTRKGETSLFIEGNKLSPYGIQRGDRFDKLIVDKKVYLIFSDTGKSKVSGRGENPVIDLNGKFLTNVIGRVQTETVKYICSFILKNGSNKLNAIQIEKVA